MRDIKHDLYTAAMEGIPPACRLQRCGHAYLEALAVSVAAEAVIESALLDSDMTPITPERVTREVAIRVGVYCSSECIGCTNSGS